MEMRTALTRLSQLVRLSDWWEYKVLPMLGMVFATALLADQPLAKNWTALLELMAALTAGGCYASLINDLTDSADDRAAGKANIFLTIPLAIGISGLILSLAVGAGFVWRWSDDPVLAAVYVAAWLAFILYSVPPIRLKARGWPGAAAVIAGEAMLPTLVAILATARAVGANTGWVWLAAAAIWSACHGARAIIWHQLGDLESDRRAEVGTFVVGQGAMFAVRTGRVSLAVELVALIVLLSLIGSTIAWLALAGYATATWLRVRWWGETAVAVVPIDQHILLLQEYYVVLLPVALLLTQILRHPGDWPAVCLLLLFPRVLALSIYDASRIVASGLYGVRRLAG